MADLLGNVVALAEEGKVVPVGPGFKGEEGGRAVGTGVLAVMLKSAEFSREAQELKLCHIGRTGI